MSVQSSVVRLGPVHEPALQELLEEELEVNLFLLGFLQAHPMDRSWWIGALRGEHIEGCVLLVPGRLAVPFARDPSVMHEIGVALRGALPPRLLVGPRDDCDALYEGWGRPGRVMRWYDQRLYTIRQPPRLRGSPDLRNARVDEWRAVARAGAAMEREDMGIDPAAEDPDLHAASVKERLRDGRTWVVERRGSLVFQINVGTITPWGCQIGGTWVPPEHRGQGLATEGMAAITHQLLQRHPLVTLHVNEGNPPAVRVYEKVGYTRAAPYRLAVLQGS